MTPPLATNPAVGRESPLEPTVAARRFRDRLTEAAALKQEQLDMLPDAQLDPVLAAQCAALVQTLSEIRAASARLDKGTFGSCANCRQPISLARLEFRPWATTCTACASL